MQQIQTALPIGTIILSHYLVEKNLGQSRSSAVYLVKDLRIADSSGKQSRSNLFVLKELLDKDIQIKYQFILEGEMLKRLEHQALPRVYRVFEDEQHKRVYMLMQYIEGPKLADLRKREPQKRFSLPQLLVMMAPIIDALSYLHTQPPPLMHRAVTPANIVVSTASNRAVLVDFGIPQEYTSNKTTAAVQLPVTGYNAPEYYRGEANQQTDIYALGATFYTLLTGIVPIDALQRTMQLANTGKDPLVAIHQLVPFVPIHIAEAIHRALSLVSTERFSSVEAFRQALTEYEASKALSRHPTVPLTPPLFDRQLVAATPTYVPVAPQQADSDTSSFLVTWQNHLKLFRLNKIGVFILTLLLICIVIGAGFGQEAYTLAFRPLHTSAVLHSPIHHVPVPTPHLIRRPASPATSLVYPSVASTYHGTVHDLITDATLNIMLTQVLQNNETLHGYFTGLERNNAFIAVLDTSRHIVFTVGGNIGQRPLFFEGSVRPDGNIAGDYCSVDQGGQCTNEDYGVWSIAPA